ncbi:uncharacterized protein LOC34620626 [Cyclospora cayetanensis]|uniref:Uncharacterized protein LOC34620626 n=1 Tax=Cyclospora cayetanensis TaxID=88456 RepID=A0A6P6S269_9EIME|nr:uncharacterized protein LOC34620626 [Cyclospora cayetanensis]
MRYLDAELIFRPSSPVSCQTCLFQAPVALAIAFASAWCQQTATRAGFRFHNGVGCLRRQPDPPDGGNKAARLPQYCRSASGLSEKQKRRGWRWSVAFPTRLNEKCELNREICLLENNTSSVPIAVVQHWPLYGESVNPYDVPEDRRVAMAKNLPHWSGDFLDQRVDVLFSQIHLGVVADDKAHSAAAHAAAAVAVSAFPAGGATATADEQKADEQTADQQTADEQTADQQTADQQTADQRSEAAAAAAAAAAAVSTPPSLASKDGAAAANSSSDYSDYSSSDYSDYSSKRAPIVLMHCHHGRDRTGLIAGAYKMKYLGFSLAEAWMDNRALGMQLFEAINSLMWYCLYLERELGLPTKCYNLYAAEDGGAAFISNGKGLTDLPWLPSKLVSQPPEAQVPQQEEQLPEGVHSGAALSGRGDSQPQASREEAGSFLSAEGEYHDGTALAAGEAQAVLTPAEAEAVVAAAAFSSRRRDH